MYKKRKMSGVKKLTQIEKDRYLFELFNIQPSYTRKGCKACEQLIRECRKAGIDIRTESDPETVVEKAKQMSFRMVPFVVIETGGHTEAVSGYGDSINLIKKHVPGRKI